MTLKATLSRWSIWSTETDSTSWFIAELVIALSLLVALIGIALHYYRVPLYRAEMTHVYAYFKMMRDPVEMYWNLNGRFPPDIETALDVEGMSANRSFYDGTDYNARTSNAAELEYDKSGALTLRVKSDHSGLKDKLLTFRPALIDSGGGQRIVWLCGYRLPPANAVVPAENRTTLSPEFLEAICRR